MSLVNLVKSFDLLVWPVPVKAKVLGNKGIILAYIRTKIIFQNRSTVRGRSQRLGQEHPRILINRHTHHRLIIFSESLLN